VEEKGEKHQITHLSRDMNTDEDEEEERERET
jgi:hypothetical protein